MGKEGDHTSGAGTQCSRTRAGVSEINRSREDIHAGEQLCTYGVGFSRRKKGYLEQVSAPEKVRRASCVEVAPCGESVLRRGEEGIRAGRWGEGCRWQWRSRTPDE